MPGKSFVATLSSSERVLADGRVAVPGEPFDLSNEEQKHNHNKRLIDSGQIFEIKKPKQSEGGEK